MEKARASLERQAILAVSAAIPVLISGDQICDCVRRTTRGVGHYQHAPVCNLYYLINIMIYDSIIKSLNNTMINYN